MRMDDRARGRTLSLVLVLGALLMPRTARAWWNEEWSGRKPLRIDTSAGGANITDPIGPTAVLVRLHAGNFKFEQAKEDGNDLRFVAADDKTPLPYHVEKYDPLLGEALVWVGLPDLKPGAQTEIWLYYRNPKAVSAEDAKGTWDKATALVYHFAERGQPPRDSTAWANHALGAAPTAEGSLIANGLRLDGKAAVTIPAGPSLLWEAGAKATWSLWIKPAEAESSAAIFSRRDGGNGFLVGLEKGRPFVEIESDAGMLRAAAQSALGAGSWHSVAVTAGDTVQLYVDGARVAAIAAKLPALKGSSLLGGDAGDPGAITLRGEPAGQRSPDKGGPLPGFKGDVDELQISKVERPAGYLQFLAASQGTDPGKLIVAGQEEETGGAGTGYFGVILKSVTLDGWVVIGLLAIMAVVSWLVMVSKAVYLGAVERANDRFADRFRVLSNDLVRLVGDRGGELGDDKLLRNSSLFRLFQVGVEEVRKRTGDGGALSAQAIESIRASLDARLVREGQALSQRMVLLTIAIAGGPFLGLLGTVVGVMITFAAIAAAGDVNVNAIAPGIAAALVATVAGLGVAIPALFGYNWLLTRIKNAVAVQQVFADELITRLAESWSERPHRAVVRPAIKAAEQA